MTETIVVELTKPITTGDGVISELTVRRASDGELLEYVQRTASGEQRVPMPCLGGLPMEAVFELTRVDADRLIAAVNAVAPEVFAGTKFSAGSRPPLN